MIVCEMFLGAVDGFGGMIIHFSEVLRFADLLAAITIAGFIGYSFNLIVDSLERVARRRISWSKMLASVFSNLIFVSLLFSVIPSQPP